MPIETHMENETTICRLSGALSIWETADVWQQLRPLLDATDPLVIDLSSVESCDAAGAQILCQIDRAGNSQERSIVLTGISDALKKTIRQAGLPDIALSFSIED